MKKDIHPEYKPARIHCACGNVIETRSTKGDYEIQICSNCHPFFTGKQKFVDTAGRVERFQRRYAKVSADKVATAPRPEAAETPAAEPPAAAATATSPNPASASVAAGAAKTSAASAAGVPAAEAPKPPDAARS